MQPAVDVLSIHVGPARWAPDLCCFLQLVQGVGMFRSLQDDRLRFCTVLGSVSVSVVVQRQWLSRLVFGIHRKQ